MRRLLSLLCLLALVSLLAAATATAAPARTQKLTAAENRWAVPMVNLMKSLSGRVGAVRTLAKNPAILTKGSVPRLKLDGYLRDLLGCGAKLKKRGAPPSKRLAPFYSALKSACVYYQQAAVSLAVGIAKPDAKLVAASGTQFQHGSILLGLARDRMLALVQ